MPQLRDSLPYSRQEELVPYVALRVSLASVSTAFGLSGNGILLMGRILSGASLGHAVTVGPEGVRGGRGCTVTR